MAQISASLVQTYVRTIIGVAGVFPDDPNWQSNAVPVPTDGDYPTEQYPLWYTTAKGQMPISSGQLVIVTLDLFDALNNQLYGASADITGFFFSTPGSVGLPSSARAVWSPAGTLLVQSLEDPPVFNAIPDTRMGVRITNVINAPVTATQLKISVTRMPPI